MIQNVIILTGAGLVIFEKVWVESDMKQTEKGRMFGSLIRAMQEMSKQSTGLIVHYIEFGKVAVSIVDDSKSKLICTLFHDIEDGADFGKIIAQQILTSFMETFPDSTFSGTLNIGMFSGFTSKMFDAIQGSVNTIVQQLQGVRGVNSCLVLFDDGTAVMPTQEDDQLGVVANLQPLITLSTDLMASKKERPKLLTLETSRQIVYIHRVGEASLMAICRKSIKSPAYKPAINHAVTMLNKVFVLSRALSFKSGRF